jgi:hypothetical protein
MTVSLTQRPICISPASQKQLLPDEPVTVNKVLSPTTAEWRFKKDAAVLADHLENKLQIHKQLTEVGASVQKLLSYKRFENGGEHVVQAEFENISYGPQPTWRHVNECLDAMISCFSTLTEIHANNVYHGNPCMDNFIFEKLNHEESDGPPTKGFLRNFHDCGYINGDLKLSAKDVQIALSDFGGKLLMIAENSGYTKIRVLKMHIESQINFADQEELDDLENAPTLLNHLCSLKTLLSLRRNDYPHNHGPIWGPLSQEQVLQEYRELQERDQNSAFKKTASDQFKFPHCLQLRTHRHLEPSNQKPKTNRLEEFKKNLCSANPAGLALFTAGAAVAWLSMRAKQTDKNM